MIVHYQTSSYAAFGAKSADVIHSKLVYRNGGRRGQRVPIEVAEFLVGRHVNCDLCLKGDKVSRRHCVIVVSDARVTIQDLNSRNGTLVDGERLAENEERVLAHREKIQIGDWKFRISVRDADTGKPITEHSQSTADAVPEPGNSSAEDLIRELDALTTNLDFVPPRDQANEKWRRLEEESKLNPADTAQQQAAESETVAKPPKPAAKDKPDEDANVADSDGAEPETKGPQKIPEHLRPKGPSDSKDAASMALRRHFGV